MANFAQLSNRSIGKITLDVVTIEDHQSDLSITENPIESGAAIADHAVIQPKRVTINGVVVDHDHSSFAGSIPFLGNIRGAVDFLNNIPLPVNVATKTAQTIAKAGRLISQGAAALGSVTGAFGGARKLAPFLPDFSVPELLSGAIGGDSRVQKCYADLLASQKSGETIEIQTGIHLYKDMLIESISVSQSQDGSATFTVTAREIFVVNTQSSSSGNSNKSGSKGSAAGKTKSGRAATQSASKTQQGTTQPVKATPKKTSHLGNVIGVRK